MLTAEQLKQELDYLPNLGLFLRCGTDEVAGTRNEQGYVQIRVLGKVYLAHRLVWLYVHGEWPRNEIDHINGVRHCNVLANLREVSSSQNKMNSSLRCDNTSGTKGVSYEARYDRWRAYITADGKRKMLGSFATLDEAIAARVEAQKFVHGEFARSH